MASQGVFLSNQGSPIAPTVASRTSIHVCLASLKASIRSRPHAQHGTPLHNVNPICHDLFPELIPSYSSSLHQVMFTPAISLRNSQAALFGPDFTRTWSHVPPCHISGGSQNPFQAEVPTSQRLQALYSVTWPSCDNCGNHAPSRPPCQQLWDLGFQPSLLHSIFVYIVG